MFKFFNQKKQEDEHYFIIAFCDDADLKTKFGEYYEKFKTYESAKHRIFSKANGWGRAIEDIKNDMVKIDDAWLIIERK